MDRKGKKKDDNYKKGLALQKKVINLFNRAGFITIPKKENTKEFKVYVTPDTKKFRKADLVVKGQGKILVECKDDKKIDISSEIDKVTQTNERGDLKADAILIVSIGKKLSKGDIEYANKTKGTNVFLWDDLKLKYYEVLTSILKEYSAPEILHSFNIMVESTSEDIHFPALKINQNFCKTSNYKMYLFLMNVDYLLKYCYLLRRANLNPEAFQRLLIKGKLKKIRDYIKAYGRIPSGIIVALPEEVKFTEAEIDEKKNSWYRGKMMVGRIGKLTLPKQISSFCIIDGQHRVYGFMERSKKEQKNFEIPVIGIRGFKEKDMTKIFIEVNENSAKIDPNLLCDLLEGISDKKIIKKDPRLIAIYCAKILDKKQDKKNPFKDKIKIYQTESLKKKPITLKGFSGYDLIRLVKEDGALRKLNKENDLSKYLELLIDYFYEVYKIFKKEWSFPDKYIICTNRGVTVFLRLLERIIKFYNGKVSKAKYKEIISILNETQSRKKFHNWENKKLSGAYIGYGGWNKFEDDVVSQIKKKKEKFKDL